MNELRVKIMKKRIGLISLWAFLFLISAAYAGMFVDNGDGTVTDTRTSLMWQKTTESAMNYETAIAYCKNLTLAGHTDWRLPTKNELMSLVNKNFSKPAIDTGVFPDTISFGYWTSTTSAEDPDDIIFINFVSGKPGNADKSDTYYVRAVRGGQ
jgi:hypothetical protein